jgi:hypothetical protein
VRAGSLASIRALDNAAIALGDQLQPLDAQVIRNKLTELSYELRPAQRDALTALLEDVTDSLRRAR